MGNGPNDLSGGKATFNLSLSAPLNCLEFFLPRACISLITKILKHVVSGCCVSTVLNSENIKMSKT